MVCRCISIAFSFAQNANLLLLRILFFLLARVSIGNVFAVWRQNMLGWLAVITLDLNNVCAPCSEHNAQCTTKFGCHDCWAFIKWTVVFTFAERLRLSLFLCLYQSHSVSNHSKPMFNICWTDLSSKICSKIMLIKKQKHTNGQTW